MLCSCRYANCNKGKTLLYATLTVTILFLLYQGALSLKAAKLQEHADPRAVGGYPNCAVNNTKLVDYSMKYPCDFTPRPDSDVLIVTFVNSAWIPLAHNWICSAERVGLKESLYLIAFEDGVCSQLPTDIPCYRHPNANLGRAVYGNPGYQKLVIERTRIIPRLLSCTSKLVLVDADISFLKNPLAYLKGFTKDKDIVFQADSIRVKMVDTVLPYFFSYICGGFIYMNSNNATRQLWLSVLQYQEDFLWNDQAGLNICIRHSSQTVRWANLDSEYFPNGQQFFAYNMNNPRKIMIVHANHFHDEEKIVRMIGADVWCYTPAAVRICNERTHQSICNGHHNTTLEWCNDFHRVCRAKYTRRSTTN
jgi:hypothetical protein